MRTSLIVATGLLALGPTALFADLTVDQKVADFQQLAALYAKNYGPYELKRDLYGFDLFDISGWLGRVRASKTDIEFWDICTQYVAGLRDSHDEFTIPATFDAWLHFDGDLYDGKFLIDYIDRSYLPSARFPFTIGDELVSVDGVAVADLIVKFRPYSVNGMSNPVSRDRLAAGTITERYQGWNVRAPEIGKSATIVVNRQANGQQATYTIPWDVNGTPVTTAGIIPSPKVKQPRQGEPVRAVGRIFKQRGVESDGTNSNAWGATFDGDGPELIPDEPTPEYMKTLNDLQTMGAATRTVKVFPEGSGLSPFDSLVPVFNPPAGFKLRLGASRTDQFLSGTFPVGNKTVGFIRIPTMSPSSTATALAQFSGEIAYFQQNTDGLVIDVMGNGGGSICYTETLASMLIPGPFQRAHEELRATVVWQQSFASSLENAQLTGAPGWVVATYQFLLDAVTGALSSNRARTGGLPLCSYSDTINNYVDSKGVQYLYMKPILVLVDNFTLSSGEVFTMFLQDYNRATIFGTTTDGGGGNVVSYNSATSYSEGRTRMTQGVLVRQAPFQVPGFPALTYYDGVGIYPDIWQDFMTKNNLLTAGSDFIKAAVSAIGSMIQ